MTIDINPYADTLSFPPGTPPSVINAVLSIRARADAQRAAQPDPWEQGINSIINGATNKLVFPWLQNEFVNLPYQTDLTNMQTNEAIRRYQEEQGYLTGQEKQRLQDKYDLANQGFSDFGNAIGAATAAYQPTPESFYDSGPTTPYGPYEDATSASPGPQYSPPLNNMGNVAPESGGANIQDLISQQSNPTSLQGDIASTNRDRIMKYSPENNPTTSDMFRTVAGQNPLYAGILANAFEKNQNLSKLLDPMQQRLQQAQEKRELAQAGNLESQAGARNAMLPGQLGLLDAKQQETLARSGLIYGQDEMNRIKIGVIRDIQAGQEPSKALLSALKMEGHDPMSGVTLAKLTFMSKAMSPDDPMKPIVDATVKDLNQQIVNRGIQTAQGTIAPAAAKAEAFKVQQEIGKTKKFLTLADKVLPAIDLLDQADLLPKSPDVRDQAWALKNQSLSRDIAAKFPGVTSAQQLLSQFYGALDVATVRGLGDLGARIKQAYGLPEKPMMLTKDQAYTVVNLFRQMAQENQDENIQTLIILHEQAGGNPVIMGPYGGMQPSGGKTPPPGFRRAP